MNRPATAIAIGSALTAATLSFAAPALAAPTAVGNAQDTIAELESQGYHVVVKRLSDAPLYDANIVSTFVDLRSKPTVSVNVR
ncbi:hypothetical protein BVC93_17850 [Mycobacterium sp. MS1601]|uniref:hypothetical protein n=1 Tax=Mycobacterium sp. MS1601 TaxID=1936029 RepID=UPI0009792CEC|nr:hypothetical protein [Mycobacterium sp. MS1601]AQA03986.1 hypothetical protein BVC93_17850 [Mycobacterium sp. MS1601]